MDVLTLMLLGALLLAVAALVVVLLQRQGGNSREAEQMRQQLGLALSQQAETVQRVERSLRDQEQALAKAVGERLDRTEKATGQIVTDLRERLARIDEAQKKIGDLSTQVVSLQEVLSNKQARGAFGEVQLNDLVQNALPPQAYEFQCTLSSGVRADCLLKLPNPPARSPSTPSSRWKVIAPCVPCRRAMGRRCWSRSAPSSRPSASTSATSATSTSCPARPPNRR